MDPDSANTQQSALDNLRECARRFCAVIEAAESASDIGLLRRMNELVPELYLLAVRLPDLDPWAAKADEPDDPVEVHESQAEADASLARISDWTWAQEILNTLLGNKSHYRLVFDPIRKKGGATDNSIAGDLADIYADLKHELYLDEHSAEIPQDESERLWHWRWQFRNHWGTRHAAPTLAAIAWLVSEYWDEYEDEWSTELDTSAQT